MTENESKQTALEKVAGSLGTNLPIALIAASGGGYLAPLLPALLGSLADGRYRQRVSNAFEEINSRLADLKDKVENLTDAQYKLINEIVSAVTRTTDEGKLEYLVDAVSNGV